MDEKVQEQDFNRDHLYDIERLQQVNNNVLLGRLPTLGEILANRTRSPVSLYNFYEYMKEVEYNVDYLDFWFDMASHMNLCKHYVKGLRESVTKRSSHRHSQNRDSHQVLEGSKPKSVSSSVLLDLILDDNLLQEGDSRRLSLFLRGDLEVSPRLSDLINHYENATSANVADGGADTSDGGPVVDYSADDSFDRAGSLQKGTQKQNTNLLADNSYADLTSPLTPEDRKLFKRPPRYSINQQANKRSSVDPHIIENLLRNSPNRLTGSFINRENLHESSQNLLLKYFVEDSEKNLNLPDILHKEIIKGVETDGRDDPDVFNNVRQYVYGRLENEYLPNFLNLVAIRNINRKNKNIFVSSLRVALGFFLLFGGFWMGYSFIFLNFKKGHRLYIIIPFIIACYCLITSLYLVDPILLWLGYGESFTQNRRFLKIEEHFIYRLLLKRSLWVTFFILVATACFVVLFSLVPGHRL